MFDHHQHPEFHRNPHMVLAIERILSPPCEVWNDLSHNLRAIESRHIFKIHLKEYLLNKYLPI